IPRERVFQAVAALVPISNPHPDITTLTPARTRANSAFTLTIAGTGLNAFSTLRWNGTEIPSTTVSAKSMSAFIPASLVSAVGTASVTVFTPAPGGGESSPLTLNIDPPPSLALSAAAVGLGGAETVSLSNGFGGQYDWLALAATGAPDTSYLQWTFVG